MFNKGLELLASPSELYDSLNDDSAKGALIKAIFTRLYVDADEDRRAFVSGHDLAEPFDAITAAQAAWRWTTLNKPDKTEDSGQGLSEAVERALSSRRGRHPDGVTASSSNSVTSLLASVFDDHGSCKAKMVELQGLEPWTSSMPWKRSSQLSYSPNPQNFTRLPLESKSKICAWHGRLRR